MKNKLLLLLMLLCATSQTEIFAKKTPARVINADFSVVVQEKSDMYLNCVGAGRAAEGLRASWREQLNVLQKEAPFDYMRFHGLFHDDMGVYMETNEGKGVYNFQYIDDLYDYMLSVGIRPFVELSFMPDALKSYDKTVFWWKGNAAPPKDYERWGELVYEFTKHVTKRYGREEVRKWYFEVWNEPNHKSFFGGTQEDYFRLYKYAAQAIVSVDDQYRVGGPATAGNSWVPDFIKFCEEENLPMDFVSTHTYGVVGNLDEFGKKQLQLRSDYDYIPNSVNRIRSEMDSLGQKDVELHYTEWNTSYSPTDYTHDTYLNAPFILNVLRKVNDNVQSMSYWTFTDIFEEVRPPMQYFHGGFGLMTLRGLKKPSYFSYKYLHELGDMELQNSDPQSWVCKDENGDIQMLAYDLTMPTYEPGENNNIIFNKERVAEFKNNLEFNINNVPNGDYYVEVYKIGYLNKDIRTLHIKMGKPKALTTSQHDILEQHTQDYPIKSEFVSIEDGKYSIELPIYENDVYMVKLKRSNK